MADIDAIVRELRAAAEKATPRPWQARFLYRTLHAVRAHQDYLKLFPDPTDRDWPDAEYIALCANHMPEILDALAAQKAENAQHLSRIQLLNQQACRKSSDMSSLQCRLDRAEAENEGLREELKLLHRDFDDSNKLTTVLRGQLETADKAPHPDPLVAEVERRGKA